MKVLQNRLYRSKWKFVLCIITILLVPGQIAIASNLSEDKNINVNTNWTNNPVVEEFYVAVEEMPASSDVINFNLTSMKCPNLLSYDLTTDSRLESLNFSINNECQIPATSFEYTTSMYTGNDNISRISWLGQPYYVIDHNNKSMNITGFLVDEGEDDTRLLREKETLALPEGFAITVSDIFIDDGDNVEIILTQYGEEKDKQIVNESEWYEYRSNMNRSDQTDNLILRFSVETLFCGWTYNFVKINSLRLISSDVLRINNEDILRFSLEDSRISWYEQPYCVIDDNTTHLTIARLLVDKDTYHTYRLKKGDILMLPDGYAITILDIDPYIPLDKYRENDFGYGQFLFSLTRYGKEIDKKVVREIDSYEYTVDLNGNGQNDNQVLRFNIGEIFSGRRFEWVEINSIGLISSDVFRIENSDEINIILEGYKTNIENNGTTVTVVRDDLTKNINLAKDGSTTFMDNWFTVKVNSASDAVIISDTYEHPIFILQTADTYISSAEIKPTTYELVGALEYIFSGYADVKLTSKDNPAVLYYDLENAQGHETLNLSINNNYDPPYIDDPYRIPADSFVYSTRIYPTRDHNYLKIAWLGEPYMVIDHNSSTVVINKFLIDERSDDCYQLSIDNPLDLPYGFNLTASINDSNIACFSLIKDGLEVYNTTARAGDIFQYKEDLNSNGINDNLILSFTVESANKPIGSVMINSLWMISPESLMINDGDVDMLATYKINIKNAGSTIEVRIKENYYEYIHNDIILKEDKLTGILNNTFFIRVNGAVEVVKLLNTTDTQQYEHELIKRRVNSDKIKMPDIMKNDTNRTDEITPDKTTPDVPVPGFGLFMCIMILLFVRKKIRNN